MSQSHVRGVRKEPQTKRNPTVGILVAAVLMVFCILLAGLLLSRLGTGNDETAWGKILETRIVTVGNIETGHGGRILYRLETYVQYSVHGEARDRWIPVSGGSSGQASLQLQLLDGPKQCLVYWSPGNEDNAHCKLQPASK